MEPLGLAIGIGSLLIAFKGAVDSFVLIDAIAEADNGQHYLALQYFIEKQKLVLWADACQLSDTESSSLRNESLETRKLIAAALAEIKVVNTSAKKYLKRYEMGEPTAPKAADGSFVDLTSINDALIKAMENDRAMHRPVKRFQWATKDKTKFGELVVRLTKLVADLHELSRASTKAPLHQGLPVYVIPSITDPNALQALQQDANKASLLALSALLKQLQVAPFNTQSASSISLDALGLSNNIVISQTRDFRLFCDLTEPGKLDRRVWVEWKSISANLDSGDRDMLEKRIKELAALLSAPKPIDYRVPLCLGLTRLEGTRSALTDVTGNPIQGQPHHFGFVYEYPSPKYDSYKAPKSLLDLLQGSLQMPLLNDRFALAYRLASVMSLLHASRWLHRGFRSSRVLFFSPEKGSIDITEPYVTGFELSRSEDAKSSIETVMTGDAAIDLYYHPNTAQGFNRLRDYYSLGVVLFEIALWRSLEVKIPKDRHKPLNKMKLEEVHNIIIESLPALGSVMGSTYRDIVELCLTGAFGHQDDQDGVRIGRVFFHKVVRALGSCSV